MDTILRAKIAEAGRSKYPALAAGLRGAIADGTLAPGEKLPPVRDLAYRLGVTPGTVARAYAVLTEAELLVGEVGRGTFVSPQARGAGAAARERSGDRAEALRARARRTEAVPDTPDLAHFLSPRLPDEGQADLIQRGLTEIGAGATVDDLLRYPSGNTALPAREAFLRQIAAHPIGPVDVDDIVVGHGGQNVVLMILQTVLTGATPVIAVDELSYGGFRSAALLLRADVVAVPSDADGPDPAALEALIRSRGVQVFCTSAEVNNPTLAATSEVRRREIAAIALRHGVHVIDDECYARHPRRGPSYRALLPDLGWLVASPSKSLSAALRIGFGAAPKVWSARAARTATYSSFGVSRIITDLYAWLMAHPEVPGIDARIRDRIARDVRAAVTALGGHRIAWDESVPLLWLDLPVGWRAGEFCDAAREVGVLVKSAEDFAMRDSRQVHAVRIAINGLIPHDVFADAMARLRMLLETPPQRISA